MRKSQVLTSVQATRFALAPSTLRFGPSITNVHRTLWTFATSSLSRGRVRILSVFRKHASGHTSMLTLPARKKSTAIAML